MRLEGLSSWADPLIRGGESQLVSRIFLCFTRVEVSRFELSAGRKRRIDFITLPGSRLKHLSFEIVLVFPILVLG
jgi:hypothetical protein